VEIAETWICFLSGGGDFGMHVVEEEGVWNTDAEFGRALVERSDEIGHRNVDAGWIAFVVTG